MKTGVGIVEPRRFCFGSTTDRLGLDCGQALGPIEVRYETYGTLNEGRSNAVLIVHAFSGDAHVAGVHSPQDRRPGWWDAMIGPGRPIDTERYFVVCSNVLGGCGGTTGPGSIDLDTGKQYALSFPVITIRDIVKVQKRLIDSMGIERLLSVVGGSMGGMQALEWSVSYPDCLRSAIVIASPARISAQGIAFNAVARNAIMSDLNWRNGKYYGQAPPARGLAIARMIGHITYLSNESMGSKFGRRLQKREQYGFDFDDQFAVESYLKYQGEKFVDRFDANSYIYLSKAIDYFDLGERYDNLETAFAQSRCRYLVISYTTDWLYTPQQSRDMVYSMTKSGRDVSYVELSSPFGHDSFLLDQGRKNRVVESFLASVYGQ